MAQQNPLHSPLRKVRKLSGILAFCAVGALWTTNAQAQYCNTATTNTAITPTTVSQNTVSVNSGIRAFNFTTVAGRSYTFATCGLTTGDTFLRLYSTGTGGTVLASNDDGCGAQSTITYVETVSSTRSVLVAKYSCAALTVATQMSYVYSAPAVASTCANPTAVINTFPHNSSRTTCGAGNTYGTQCGGNYGGGEDMVFQLTIATTGTYTIAVNATGGGTYVGWFLKGGANCATASSCLANATSGSGALATGTYNFTTAGTYYLIVDTWPSPDCVPFNLSITAPGGGGSGCTSSTSYQGGAVAAPGGSVTLTTCAYGGEYSPATGLMAANTYTITGSGGTGNYLTIRTSAGVLIQAGLSPQVLTAYTGDIRVLVNVNAACATDATCHTLAVATGGGGPVGGCLTATNGQYPFDPVTPTCTGIPVDVAEGCGYASEYSVLNLTSGVNYIFTSSIATDYITISNGAGTTALVFGTGPVNYTPTSTTTYRFYTHTNSTCGAQSSCRLRYVQCGAPLPPPANNDCANAVSLTVGATGTCPASATAGTTVGATGGAAPYPSCLAPGLMDVWYSFNSGANTNIQFNITLGTMTARAIQLLTACGGTETYCLADLSSGTFPVTASTNYRLRILTTGGGAGTFSICLQTPPPPPANDACANAIVVNTYPYTSAVINNTDATDDYTTTACDGPYKNVWWKVSGVCGIMSAKTCTGNTNFDTEMAVFSGTCGAFTQITCNDDGGPASCTLNQSSVSWTATQGTDYYISVGSYYTNYITGNLQLNVTAVDGDGDGTGDVCDLCPSDPNKIEPGTCGCGVPDTDTDGDLTADCNDGCPNDPNKIAPGDCGCGNPEPGATCDDGNATTINDVIDANCTCVGTLLPNDCLGVPGGPALPGTTCDDANACTTDDVYDANCGCSGTAVNTDDGDPCTLDSCDPINGVTHVFQDADSDGTCDANDLCPNDPNKITPGNCGCGNDEPGATCDDGNPNTTGDVIDANCTCTGTPVGACTGNEVVVAIFTDNTPEDLTWVITDASNTTIATGGPNASQENVLVLTNACLSATPTGECYGFKLMDAAGNGITGGYWQLQTTNGKVLLGDDFATGASSPSATPTSPGYGSFHSFCLPKGPANIAPTECGIFNNMLGNKVYATKVTGAANYQFEFSDPDAGFMRRIARPYNYVHFWDMVTNPLTPGVKYFARVRTDRDGPMLQQHFGSGCEMGISVPLVVTCTQLIQAPAYGHSCNETRTFNTSANNSFIYATPVQGATEYQFRINNGGEGYSETFIRSTYILQLKWNATVAPPLIDGNTYNVELNVKVNGVYSGFCASQCNITIDNAGNRPEASMMQTNGTTTMWPNPVRDGQVNLNIDGLVDPEQNITVNIQDIYGKQVFAKEFGNSGERFNAILNLNSDIASGVYMVNITVNGERTVQRLSIIR